MNFWNKLSKPFFALAPLEDVTDAAFRRLIAKYGKPDVMFTEFTSADGLLLSEGKSKEKIFKKLLYSDSERPIVAQLFTAVPERMEKAARLCAELGFDGIDINMGCPDRAVERGGCGAALMKNAPLARELIRAAKRGASSNNIRFTKPYIIPVSVKTRIGYNKDELETWLPELLAEEPAAVTIHARTRKEMSDVPARWDAIARAVQIRNSLQNLRGENPRGDASWIRTLIVGNGDVKNLEDAREKARMSGCDGVMLGRAIFGNPWLFQCSQEHWNRANIQSREERLMALDEHLMLWEELLSDTSNFAIMKKHFKAYVSGFEGAKELRTTLMDSKNAKEAHALLSNSQT